MTAKNMKRAVEIARDSGASSRIMPPILAPGVVPDGAIAPVMDANQAAYIYGVEMRQSFPGFAYLANLATLPEYTIIGNSIANEMTRAGFELTYSGDDGNGQEKIGAIEAELKRLHVWEAIRRMILHDCIFGAGNLYIDVNGQDAIDPLIIDSRAIRRNSLRAVKTIDPIWMTPSDYNSIDPLSDFFYTPREWFVMGRRVHASRILRMVSRPLPDLVRPAYNFCGLSLYQMLEPYVRCWDVTRRAVTDMVYTFSTTVLATDMSGVLQGDDNGAGVLDRADLFTATRSNRGVMLVDKEREELSNVAAPLGGLDEIMTSSLEYLCVISHLPAVVLTGQTPHGLNASAEGELAAFADWIASQQEANIRPVLDAILRVVQASLFGEIDPAIGFRFQPLMQMSAREQAEIRQIDAGVDQQYLDAGILDPSEVRERIMGNDDGYYDNLDPDAAPWEDREAEEEAEWATQQPAAHEQQQPDGGAA